MPPALLPLTEVASKVRGEYCPGPGLPLLWRVTSPMRVFVCLILIIGAFF